jgi:hypothetical protein
VTSRTTRAILAVVYHIIPTANLLVVGIEGSRRRRRLKERLCGWRIAFLACGREGWRHVVSRAEEDRRG